MVTISELPRCLHILGVRVDDVTEDEAVARCERFIVERRRSVVTPNPEIVLAARGDRALRHALARADLAIPDGGGLLLAARWWGMPLEEYAFFVVIPLAGILTFEAVSVLWSRRPKPSSSAPDDPDRLTDLR